MTVEQTMGYQVVTGDNGHWFVVSPEGKPLQPPEIVRRLNATPAAPAEAETVDFKEFNGIGSPLRITPSYPDSEPLTRGSTMEIISPRMTALTRNLSATFLGRLQRFAGLRSDWDGRGAEPIPPATTKKARQLAFDSLIVANEPFVAPANDGSILMKWDFPRARSVECFVGSDEDHLAVVTGPDCVQEVNVSSPGSLLALLKKVADDHSP